MSKNSAQDVISSYRKRQQMGPFIGGALAVILAIVGILILVLWLTGGNRPAISLFATKTPTATATFTPTPTTPTATATMTATVTMTPTVTATATPSGPFEYVVQEGENCFDIATKFNADINVLISLNPAYGATCAIKPNDVLLIPLPDQELPTATSLPTNLARGTKINYTVVLGDSLGGLAVRFNSTVEAIQAENKLEGIDIFAGQVLVIPVNIVTPVPTRPASTATKAGQTPVVPTVTASVTPTP